MLVTHDKCLLLPVSWHFAMPGCFASQGSDCALSMKISVVSTQVSADQCRLIELYLPHLVASTVVWDVRKLGLEIRENYQEASVPIRKKQSRTMQVKLQGAPRCRIVRQEPRPRSLVLCSSLFLGLWPIVNLLANSVNSGNLTVILTSAYRQVVVAGASLFRALEWLLFAFLCYPTLLTVCLLSSGRVRHTHTAAHF